MFIRHLLSVQAAVFPHSVDKWRQPCSRTVLPPYDECLMHFQLDFTTGPDAERSACFRAGLQLLMTSQCFMGSFSPSLLSRHSGSPFLSKVSPNTVSESLESSFENFLSHQRHELS